jgi:PAS domain S-box-containing protein
MMRDALQTRILAVALALATLGVCVLAGFNLSQELGVEFPTDGVVWVEVQGGLQADRVPTDSPAWGAGIRPGDILQSINGEPTPRLSSQVREMYSNGLWDHAANYSIIRPMRSASGAGAMASVLYQVWLEPADRSMAQGSRLIALVYLLIGLYVLFRRWTAPKSLHFYIFCLVSFVLYAFRSTGEPGLFDQVISWGNLLATMLQPALFLHFAVSFSDLSEADEGAAAKAQSRLGRYLLPTLLYVPGAFLVGLQVWAIERWSATGILSHRLDQIHYGYMALYYVSAAVVFYQRYRRAESPLERQQLKWLTRGTLLAVGPFTVMYAIPFLVGFTVPILLSKLVLLFLAMLPLTFSWAIVRYRLMDVDLIFKRGVTYTLATAALVGFYFLAVGITSEMVHAKFPSFGYVGPIVAILVVGLSFDPLKRMIQAWVDRVFDQKSFDYRETLIDFGRSLNSQTDLRALVNSIVQRLPETLLVTRVAVFLAMEDGAESGGDGGNGQARQNGSPKEIGEARLGGHFELAASHGLANLEAAELRELDVRFLDFDRKGSDDHIFLENPQQVLRLPDEQRKSAGLLDLNYYLPCRVANREGGGRRTVAILGLGRTDNGDFLSSEDMEVLGSLAGYIGIAIQNAQLYRRLEQKIGEFERLKEFHENIVESIHIGVFAVDLEDRIESWNAQMEAMYARSRSEALGQRLAAIFPPEFMAHFDSVRNEQGTHTFYKIRLLLPTGETRVANIAIAPLLTRDFAVVGRIVLVDDITDRMELEAQLTQAEKLSSIGLLAAGVAHEVNTPLAVISSYTQMLAKQMRPMMEQDKRLAPVLDKITQQTFRASEIVNGLLNFSRTGGSEFSSIDLNRLLLDTLMLVDHQFKTARIRVETELDQELPRIQGNEGKLQQVVLNLLLNARDAMHDSAEGRMRITTQQKSGRVTVIVQDFGNGIEPEHLHRIFDPFFTTKSKPGNGQHKGTGLGLAVSYGIMQEHGGKMQVESEVGVGTTFRLEFPSAGASRMVAGPSEVTESTEDAAHAPTSTVSV